MALKKVDPAVIKEAHDLLDWALTHGNKSVKELSTISTLRRSTVGTINRGVGYSQGEPIGTMVAPEVNSSEDGDERASYLKWGKEAFFDGADDTIPIRGNVKTADVDGSWQTLTLDVHANQVIAEPRELRIAAANGMDLAAAKFELARQKTELKKEVNIAAVMTNSSNFTTNATLTSGGTGTRWDNYAANGSTWYSLPLTDIADKKETVRGLTGRIPRALFVGPKVFKALRFHPQILSLVSGGATKANPGAPIGADLLAALLDVDLYVGNMVKTTTNSSSASLTDVWGKFAGLVIVGEADLYSPQFALTLTSGGYPKTLQFHDMNIGAEGSHAYRYVDAYKTTVVMADGGALFTTAVS